MGGFAEVEADDVTVLVNAAELGSKIDSSAAEAALEKAKADFNKFEGEKTSTEKLKSQQNLNKARARFQATKSG